MRPTVREGAREAGVSIATVSHALSGKRPVSGATRGRIKSAARRLGYRPNQVAASMITGRTQTLGVIVPDIANPFFSGLVHAAEVAAAGRGYTVVVCTAELDPALEMRHVEVLHDKRVDGLLYLGGTDRTNRALRALARAGTPIVALDEALLRQRPHGARRRRGGPRARAQRSPRALRRRLRRHLRLRACLTSAHDSKAADRATWKGGSRTRHRPHRARSRRPRPASAPGRARRPRLDRSEGGTSGRACRGQTLKEEKHGINRRRSQGG